MRRHARARGARTVIAAVQPAGGVARPGAPAGVLAGKQRIAVVGSGGAGKSTFARRLQERTGLPVIHLDREHWRPGWVETPADEWRVKVAHLVSGDRWIMDGNYGGTLELRVARADAVVFFDFPRATCLWGIVKRRTKRGGRPDMGEGCPERLDLQFLRWVWRYNKDSRPEVIRTLSAATHETEIVTVRTRRQVKALLRGSVRDDA